VQISFHFPDKLSFIVLFSFMVSKYLLEVYEHYSSSLFSHVVHVIDGLG